MDNHRSVPFWTICVKLFEKIIFDAIFHHLTENNLLNPDQSGLMPGDFCVHQLIWTTHEIYASFKVNPLLEVRGVFLEIPKTFDCVWDKGLHCKIKCDLLNLIESSLFERQQGVVLNEQESEWKAIKAGVPQGFYTWCF